MFSLSPSSSFNLEYILKEGMANYSIAYCLTSTSPISAAIFGVASHTFERTIFRGYLYESITARKSLNQIIKGAIKRLLVIWALANSSSLILAGHTIAPISALTICLLAKLALVVISITLHIFSDMGFGYHQSH